MLTQTKNSNFQFCLVRQDFMDNDSVMVTLKSLSDGRINRLSANDLLHNQSLMSHTKGINPNVINLWRDYQGA